MKKSTLRERLSYRFDTFMSKGTIALIIGLAAISMAFIAMMALVVVILGIRQSEDNDLDFIEASWLSLMRTLDAGTMGGDEGWSFRFAMLAVTLGGIFIISTLIGLLTSGIEAKLEEMRKGRSRVVESGHTVILGWSQQIFAIISELIEANGKKSGQCIVVLSEKDKVEMEDEIAARIEDRQRMRIVCRSGNTIDPSDLQIANLNESRAIVIPSPEGDKPDNQVIKTLLAIINGKDRRAEPYHIVAALHDPKTLDVARMVGGNEAELVLAGDLIARVIAQTCRQSGLSVVYTELLDFGGDEIYFANEKSAVGKTFGETLAIYDGSAVMGIHPNGGTPRLNPPMDTLINVGDKLIVISEDGDSIRPTNVKDTGLDEAAISLPPPASPEPERALILGWNNRGGAIIRELDNYVAHGSEITVISETSDAANDLVEVNSALKNSTLTFKVGDTTDRGTLNSLGMPTYDHVILLCYSDTMDIQNADAKTLITLLHLRDIAAKTGAAFSIVSEMMDIRNRALAETAQADDFVVSEKLISLLLSQISENKQLNAVFADLFDPDGSEIYLKPVTNYVLPGQAVTFYTVLEAARRRGEVAIGYRIKALSKDRDHAYGVVVNPEKSERVTFSAEDRVVVLAEN